MEEQEREIWITLPIKGFSQYIISSFGEISLDLITSKTKERVYKRLKGNYTRRGYKQVCLTRSPKITGKPNSKTFFVHKLVARAFMEHTPCGHEEIIGHKDDDKTNNYLNNLEKTTNRLNVLKSSKNSTGFSGVRKNGKGFNGQIKIGDTQVYLGQYKTPEQANEAYQKAVKKIEKYNIRTFKEFKNMK